MSIEQKVYLDLARIWNLGPGEVEKIVRDYIEAVTCDFEPLKLYSKPRICIRPVKVKTLKERLEDTKMKNDIYPLVVVLDRYNGTYSGGKWTAWNLSYVPWKIDADDTECADFFAKNMIVYGRGETPQEAIDDLKMILDCGISDPDEEDEDEDEEEEKMEPTSVWRIEGINDIWIAQDVDGMSLMLKNKDDLTKIMLSGDAIDNYNNTFAISLQADMIEYAKKMRKLEKENEELKAKSKEISNDNASLLATNVKLREKKSRLEQRVDRLLKENMKLREDYELLLEGNKPKQNKTDLPKTPITDAMLIDEYSKLVKENKELKQKNKELKQKYINKNEELSTLKLNTPKQETTAETPSSRRDILGCAEKCVCGQREQDYGTPESNFQLIADLWNDYLGNNLSKEKRDFEKELGVTHNHKELSVPWEISAMDVSMMMALLKIARIKNGGGSGDSFVDLAGYAACGGEIWADEKKSKDQK